MEQYAIGLRHKKDKSKITFVLNENITDPTKALIYTGEKPSKKSSLNKSERMENIEKMVRHHKKRNPQYDVFIIRIGSRNSPITINETYPFRKYYTTYIANVMLKNKNQQ